MPLSKYTPRKKAGKFNQELYDAVWDHLLNGPLSDYSPHEVIAHYGAVLRSFEVNLEDHGFSAKKIAEFRRMHFKVEKVLQNAAKELKELGW